MNYLEMAPSSCKLHFCIAGLDTGGFLLRHVSTSLSVGQCSAKCQGVALCMERVPNCW